MAIVEQLVRRRSGTARRAGRSRGSRAAPSRCGCRAGSAARSRTASTLRRRIGISRRARAVGRVRVEAEEAPLADHVALRVEALDAHVVEVGRPVHGRARVGLGEVEQVGLERARAHGGRQLSKPRELCRRPRRMPRPVRTAASAARRPRRQLVLAVAEEGEVVVLEPARGRPRRLGDLVGSSRRRVALELRGHVERLAAHRVPVLHRRAHLADHALEVPLELARARPGRSGARPRRG